MKKLNAILPLNTNYIRDKGCCPTMDQQLNYSCEQHEIECPDIAIRKNDEGEYSLHAPNTIYQIYFCPWCGKDLLPPFTVDKSRKMKVICHRCGKPFERHPLLVSGTPVIFGSWVCDKCHLEEVD